MAKKERDAAAARFASRLLLGGEKGMGMDEDNYCY
jgi:hypothetical protein